MAAPIKTSTAPKALSVKQSFNAFVVSFSVGLCLLMGLWAYCMTGAPAPVSGFTQKASLDMAHACGIHFFDPPISKKADGTTPLKVTDLPEGYYISAGSRPGQTPPRWVVINPGGTISWLDVKLPDSATSLPAAAGSKPTPSKGSKATGTIAEKHFEEYAYPRIKWEAKPLDGRGAAAQLWTTYDKDSPGEDGKIKYRLTLFKAAGKGTYHIQLLDEGGFKILEFPVSDFRDVPGTQLMDARDSFTCSEEQYRQVRDYAIN